MSIKNLLTSILVIIKSYINIYLIYIKKINKDKTIIGYQK
jgi:hypothetical protein